MRQLIAGVVRGARDGAAALADANGLIGACPQERATRVRNGGGASAAWPNEAIDLLLQRLGRTRADIGRYVVADGDDLSSAGVDAERIGHDVAHAATAYLTSPFASSIVVVCDHDSPSVSVWTGEAASLSQVSWPWPGGGFADALSRIAAAVTSHATVADQRLEALARLQPDARDPAFEALVSRNSEGILVDRSLDDRIAERLAGDRDPGSRQRTCLAAGLQARIGDLLLEFLGEVQRQTGATRLCLGGSLFYRSKINTMVKQSGLFDDVFIPVDPGNRGLAVGAALRALGRGQSRMSPFAGPSYGPEETKGILDNCKLNYSWVSEEGAVSAAVEALRAGRLVGWFDGPMEWGPRALGARCILANPTAPYVLENLNRFLKQREPWRGYALSGLQESVSAHFDGPAAAPFMECDYRPRQPERWSDALPSPGASVRLQTVGHDGLPQFRRLLEVFGESTGLPFLVNTSFNGFHEPIVCSPRDAVRVFYGSGLDLLVINQFLVRK
ncbi:MAG: hypothetical protein OEW19_18340 [Acidobacteriota bacterium]|nr:hypothetical protein [Acidobacteriota bacterium]